MAATRNMALAVLLAAVATTTMAVPQNGTAAARRNLGESCDFTCATGACLAWENVMDGTNNCDAGDDETAGRINHCPEHGSTNAIPYYTFSTDPGRDYATLHQHGSLTARPCVFPFKFDADGDGTVEVYETCTKACTTRLTGLMADLNPASTCVDTSPRKARLWCATSLTGAGAPATTAYCTGSCDTTNQGLTNVDSNGEPCEPKLVMPFFSANDDPTGDTLKWTFRSTDVCNARLESSADDCPLGKQERYPIPPDTTRYPEAEEDTTDTTWPDFKYYLPRSADTTGMVAITVYHPHSPQYAERLSGGVGSCEAGNPTCCEFAIRIVDVEDPALLYAPLGPAQTLARCEDVKTCGACQYEVQEPSASSDRICEDWSVCDPCSYEHTPPDATTDRDCRNINFCATTTEWQVSAAPTAVDTCTGETYYTASPECSSLTAKCDPIGDDDNLPQYDVLRLSLGTSIYDSTCNAQVYTANRACMCVTRCVGNAKEVVAVREMTDGDGDLVYIGDRVCQCPDHFTQSDRNDYIPLASNAQRSPSGTDRGYHSRPLGLPQYEPNKYVGVHTPDTCSYTCNACAECGGDTFVNRKCTHARVNMDYCQNNHPSPQCTAEERAASDSACWVPSDHPDMSVTISEAYIAAMETEYPAIATLRNVPIALYPVTRLGVIAALSLQNDGDEIYRTFAQYCTVSGSGSGATAWLTDKLLVESVLMRGTSRADSTRYPNDFRGEADSRFTENMYLPSGTDRPESSTIPEFLYADEATGCGAISLAQCGACEYQVQPEVTAGAELGDFINRKPECAALTVPTAGQFQVAGMVCSTFDTFSGVWVKYGATTKTGCENSGHIWQRGDGGDSICSRYTANEATAIHTDRTKRQWIAHITSQSACEAADAAALATTNTDAADHNYRYSWVEEIVHDRVIGVRRTCATDCEFVAPADVGSIALICADRTDTCTAGTDGANPCSMYVSDRVCTDVQVCDADRFIAVDAGVNTDRTCTALTTCSPTDSISVANPGGTLELTVPTESTTTTEYDSTTGCGRTVSQNTADRACTCHPVCDATTAEVDPTAAAPSATVPRTCRCKTGYFEETGSWANWADLYRTPMRAPANCATAVSCTACTACPVTHYETVPCTPEHDRQCKQRITTCDSTTASPNRLFYDTTHSIDEHTTSCDSVAPSCTGTAAANGNPCTLNPVDDSACKDVGGSCVYGAGSGAYDCAGSLNGDSTGCSTAAAAAGCHFTLNTPPAADLSCAAKSICCANSFEDQTDINIRGREMTPDINGVMQPTAPGTTYGAGQSGSEHADRACAPMSEVSTNYEYEWVGDIDAGGTATSVSCTGTGVADFIHLDAIQARYIKLTFGSTAVSINDVRVQQVLGDASQDPCTRPDCAASTLLPSSSEYWMGATTAANTAANRVEIDLGSVTTFNQLKVTVIGGTQVKFYYKEETTEAWTSRVVGDAAITIPSDKFIAAGCDVGGPTDGVAGAAELGCTKLFIADRTICKLTVCDPCTHFQITAPESRTERACAADITVDTSDRVCAELTTCTDNQYESEYPTKVFLDPPANTDFMYTSQRVCKSFDDYNAATTHGTFDPNQWEIDYAASNADTSRIDLCPADNDRPDGECNDGGDGGDGPTLCAYGTDKDCPVRDSVRTNDCLPFYHIPRGSGSDAWVGGFWNAATVKAALPDAIMLTDPNSCYYAVDSQEKLLSWDFVGVAATLKKLSAADNFFMTAAFTDSLLTTEQKEAALAGSELNRVKITVSKLVTNADGSKTKFKVGDNTCTSDSTLHDITGTDSPQIDGTSACITGGSYDFPVAGILPVFAGTTPITCQNTNSVRGRGIARTAVYDAALSAWTDFAGARTCADYASDAGKGYCALYGHIGSGEQITANEACCACGGGQRAESFTMHVSTRDPKADGQSWSDIEEVDSTDGSTYVIRESGTPEIEAHSANIYEGPSSDWCVAQRVDTVTFQLYVFDDQAPTPVCPADLTVCTDGGISDTAKEYATVYLTGPEDARTEGSCSAGIDDRISPSPCMLYPTAVTDNVDANAAFNPAVSYEQTLTTKPCQSQAQGGSWPFVTAPVVSVESAWAAVQRGLSDTEFAHTAYTGDQFLIGTHEITFRAKDSYQNVGECTLTMEVKDCAPPRMTCADVEADTAPGVCYCTVPDLSTSAVDNSGVRPQITLVDQATNRPIDPDYKFPSGITTVLSVATDKSRALCTADNAAVDSLCVVGQPLQSTCAFTVTCTDREKPALVDCPNVEASCSSSNAEFATLWSLTNPSGTVRFPGIAATDNSGIIASSQYFGSDGLPITVDTEFPWFERSLVTYVVEDTAGNAARCSFEVEIHCVSGLWRRTESFEQVDASEGCDSSSSCKRLPAGTDLSTWTESAGHGRTSPDFIALTSGAEVEGVTTGFSSQWKPHMPATSVWLDTITATSLSEEGNVEFFQRGSTAYDNVGSRPGGLTGFTQDTETYDCDETGVMRGSASSLTADIKPALTADAIHAEAGLGYAFVNNMNGPEHLDMGDQYFVITDPDGVVELKLNQIRIPRPHSDEAERDQRWYRYSYQLAGAGELRVFVTGTRRADGEKTARIELTSVTTATHCDATTCDWHHVQEKFGEKDGVVITDGEDWSDWSLAEFTVVVQCSNADAQTGCHDVRAYVDAFAVGHRGCTDPIARNYDANAVFEYTAVQCESRTDESGDTLPATGCCDHTFCCSNREAQNYGGPSCSSELHRRDAQKNHVRNAVGNGISNVDMATGTPKDEWKGCLWATGDTTLDNMESTVKRLKETQEAMEEKLDRVLSKLTTGGATGR